MGFRRPFAFYLFTFPYLAALRVAFSEASEVSASSVAAARDALAVHYVELALAEWRRDLVLHDLDLRAIAHDAVAVLDRANATNVQTQGGVKLQSASARRRFR